MFFVLSKVLWWVAAPSNALLLLAVVGVILLWTRWRRAGRRLATLAALLLVAVAVFPVGGRMTQALENRFPVVRHLPEHVDGIITLGGVASVPITQARGQLAVGDPVERITEMAALARRYPKARVIFSGGPGTLLPEGATEADLIAPFLAKIGLDPSRVMLERQARNTAESARLVFKMAKPKPGGTWVLITSAFHMPRAVGCFREVGWNVLPYPVDFRTTGKMGFTPGFDFAGHLARLDASVHEWLGLVFYWLTGRTDAFFPAPGGS